MNTALNNPKDEPLKNIMNVSKNAQKFEWKSINRYLENVNIWTNNIINNKFRSKSLKNSSNNKFLSVSNINNNLSKSQNYYTSNYKIGNVYNRNNTYYIIPHSNIENLIINEVFSTEYFKKMDMNKFQILTSLNNQIYKYNKGIPQLVNKVNETIPQINSINILHNLTNNTHPLIKIASKNVG